MQKTNHKKGCSCAHCGSTTLSSRSPLRVFSRIFFGLIFLAAAALVLLDAFKVVTLSINTGIFVAITVLTLIALFSLFRLFWAGFFFLSATIVTIMNASEIVFSLDGQAIGGLYIGAALLTVAFHIMFHRRHGCGKGHHIGANATFGTSTKHFNDEIAHAEISCDFGTVKAHFDKATLKDGAATLTIDCNFGSIELYIPKTWKISDKTSSTFSGTQEKNHPSPSKDTPTLTLVGDLTFSGIVITYI